MELRSRVEHLLRASGPICVTSPLNHLHLGQRKHDALAEYNLRLIMLLLLVFCAGFTMIQGSDSVLLQLLIQFLMLGISIAAMVCLYHIYLLKARQGGVTNAVPAAPRGVLAIAHSPYVGSMVMEMAIWMLQCPPGVSNNDTIATANTLVLLRLYLLSMNGVLNHASIEDGEFFRRSLKTFNGRGTSTHWLHRLRVFLHTASPIKCLLAFVGIFIWLTGLYRGAESCQFVDAFMCIISTASTTGWGDVSPSTTAGRLIAVAAYVLGLLVIIVAAAIAHYARDLHPVEKNLFHLCRGAARWEEVPPEAARTIQRAWAVYHAKGKKKSAVDVQWKALRLSRQVSSFRDCRRALLQEEASCAMEEEAEAHTSVSVVEAKPMEGPVGHEGKPQSSSSLREQLHQLDRAVDQLIWKAQRIETAQRASSLAAVKS